MRWLDSAWWNHFREEYPDRFALCCGVAVAAVALGGYASVSALGGGSPAAGDYGLTGKHPALAQPHSLSFGLPPGANAGALSSWLAQGLLPTPAGHWAPAPSTGAVYAASQQSHSRPAPPYRSTAGSPNQPAGTGVTTTVATPAGTTQVSVTTSGGTTSVVATTTQATTTQPGVTLPTPVTTVTVPLP